MQHRKTVVFAFKVSLNTLMEASNQGHVTTAEMGNTGNKAWGCSRQYWPSISWCFVLGFMKSDPGVTPIPDNYPQVI